MSKNDDMGVHPAREAMGANGAEVAQRMMAADIRSIAESLREIAKSSKATAEFFAKVDTKGLPPPFMEMTEAWKKRWLLD